MITTRAVPALLPAHHRRVAPEASIKMILPTPWRGTEGDRGPGSKLFEDRSVIECHIHACRLAKGVLAHRVPEVTGPAAHDLAKPLPQPQAADQAVRGGDKAAPGTAAEMRTRRGGNAMAVITTLNPVIRGWAAYKRSSFV